MQGAAPHLVVVGFCLALLGAAVLMAILDAGEDHLRVGSFRLPSVCGFKNATGLPCPGCGLTRSWVALAQGDPGRSLQHHRVGWLIMLYAMVQLIRHGLWLVFPGLRRGLEHHGRWLDLGLAALGIALLINWPFTLASL